MVLLEKLKPEDHKTDGLVNTTRQDALNLLNEIFEVWDPPHQSWFLNNSARVAGIMATVPALFLTFRLRRLFGLQKVSKASDAVMFVPGITMAGVPAYFAHLFYVRDDIVLQETECSVCVDIRSAALQVSTAMIIPSMMSFGGAIMSAARHNLRIVPKSLKSMGLLSKGVFSKLFVPLTALTAIEIATSEFLVRKQYNDRVVVMGELERRYTIEQQRLQNYREIFK